MIVVVVCLPIKNDGGLATLSCWRREGGMDGFFRSVASYENSDFEPSSRPDFCAALRSSSDPASITHQLQYPVHARKHSYVEAARNSASVTSFDSFDQYKLLSERIWHLFLTPDTHIHTVTDVRYVSMKLKVRSRWIFKG